MQLTTPRYKDPKGPGMTKRSNIQLANIEKELAKLWADLEGDNAIRACLFNLIIYTDDPVRHEYFEEVISTVIQKFPSRIIYIRGKKHAGDDYLRTSVSAEITAEGDRNVACERITIDATGTSLERVPFIVLPHLQPDLPVFLLWGQDPTQEDTVLPQLQHLADRVIFDSEFCEQLGSFAEHVAHVCQAHRCNVADMNWARCHGWRTLLYQTLSSERRLNDLMHCKTLRIAYHGGTSSSCRHNEIQAVYLQGWIAAQMNWRFVAMERAEGNTRIVYNNGTTECTVILTPQLRTGISAGSLIRVDIESHNNSHYAFTRQQESRVVKVEITTPEACEVPYTHLLSSMRREHALLQEVFYEPQSQHYENTLLKIAEMHT